MAYSTLNLGLKIKIQPWAFIADIVLLFPTEPLLYYAVLSLRALAITPVSMGYST